MREPAQDLGQVVGAGLAGQLGAGERRLAHDGDEREHPLVRNARRPVELEPAVQLDAQPGDLVDDVAAKTVKEWLAEGVLEEVSD